MTLSSNFRYVYILQTYLKPTPQGAPFISINELIPALKRRVDAEESLKLYQDNTVAYRIRKMSLYNDEYLILLISHADKNTSAPQFENFINGNIRPIEKADEEGTVHSAHVVIKLSSISPDKPLYTMLLERVHGLSPRWIKQFLTSEIKEIFHQTYSDINGNEKSYRALVELDGHCANTIGEILESGGILKDISFVNHVVTQEGFDEEEYIEEQISKVSLKIEKGISSDGAKGIIERSISKYRTMDYTEALVRIKTDSGTKAALVDLDRGSVLEQAFFQQVSVSGFTTKLESSHSDIREDVVVKMIEKLNDDVLQSTAAA